MSIYLGVDVGANTGLAAIDENGVCILRESVALDGEYAERLAGLGEHITALISAVECADEPDDIGLLVVEEPPYKKSPSAHRILCGYEAIVIKVCEDLGVAYMSVNNATIKKVIVRGGAVGKSSKADMMSKAASLIGETVPEFKTKKERDFAQNGYDAVLCAFYARFLKEGK